MSDITVIINEPPVEPITVVISEQPGGFTEIAAASDFQSIGPGYLRKQGADLGSVEKIPAEDVENLSDVATTGSYNDLTHTPDLPPEIIKSAAEGGVSNTPGIWSPVRWREAATAWWNERKSYLVSPVALSGAAEELTVQNSTEEFPVYDPQNAQVAFHELYEATQSQAQQIANLPIEGAVTLRRPDGTVQTFKASADTDEARGAAIDAAITAGGDVFFLGLGRFAPTLPFPDNAIIIGLGVELTTLPSLSGSNIKALYVNIESTSPSDPSNPYGFDVSPTLLGVNVPVGENERAGFDPSGKVHAVEDIFLYYEGALRAMLHAYPQDIGAGGVGIEVNDGAQKLVFQITPTGVAILPPGTSDAWPYPTPRADFDVPGTISTDTLKLVSPDETPWPITVNNEGKLEGVAIPLPDPVTQSEAENTTTPGTESRLWSVLRVRQTIAAWWEVIKAANISFGGQITAPNQTAASADHVMTMGLGDARYLDWEQFHYPVSGTAANNATWNLSHYQLAGNARLILPPHARFLSIDSQIQFTAAPGTAAFSFVVAWYAWHDASITTVLGSNTVVSATVEVISASNFRYRASVNNIEVPSAVLASANGRFVFAVLQLRNDSGGSLTTSSPWGGGGLTQIQRASA